MVYKIAIIVLFIVVLLLVTILGGINLENRRLLREQKDDKLKNLKLQIAISKILYDALNYGGFTEDALIILIDRYNDLDIPDSNLILSKVESRLQLNQPKIY